MGCLKAVADYLPTEPQPTCCGLWALQTLKQSLYARFPAASRA
jgi:hypothetical protein